MCCSLYRSMCMCALEVGSELHTDTKGCVHRLVGRASTCISNNSLCMWPSIFLSCATQLKLAVTLNGILQHVAVSVYNIKCRINYFLHYGSEMYSGNKVLYY